MPTVQFVNIARGISVTKDIPTPKRISELSKWLKECQKAIPIIPRNIAESELSADRSMGQDGWFVAHTDVDLKWIRFDLESKFGEKSQIVINRTTGAFR